MGQFEIHRIDYLPAASVNQSYQKKAYSVRHRVVAFIDKYPYFSNAFLKDKTIMIKNLMKNALVCECVVCKAHIDITN